MTTKYTKTTLNEIRGNDGENYDLLCDTNTYQSESKNWIIVKEGGYQQWGEDKIWNRNLGKWEVIGYSRGYEKTYGYFKTLKSAKQYIEEWIEYNPQDK
tara:strand:- start:138 stop:434 length:297 start_codon:yes stop_codon:yes gene_type:complete